MENKHVIELLPEYSDGLLSDEEMKKVAVHLKNCDSCSKELSELNTLLEVFKEEETENPSDAIRTNFFSTLEREKQEAMVVQTDTSKSGKGDKTIWTFLKVAAGIALLISSFLLGLYQKQSVPKVEMAVTESPEKETNINKMMALLENSSASKRIQGVNYVSGFEYLDETIAKALVDRMLNDENINVRLTAVEALTRFTASERVKDSYVKALKTEKDPSIQISIIRILVKIQEKKALDPMRGLLERKNTAPYVKEQLKLLIPSLI